MEDELNEYEDEELIGEICMECGHEQNVSKTGICEICHGATKELYL